MLTPSRTQLIVYAIALCAIAWLGARYLSREPGALKSPDGVGVGQPDTGHSAINVRPAGGGRVTVHVAGAVRHPGVYRLKEGSRVQQAVRSAGGATRGAFLDALNLAGKLEDGRQIVVPRRVAGGAAGSPAVGVVATPSGAPEIPIDLNTAPLEVLDTLDGVGPATAQKILDYREKHGGFGSVEELGEVSGIGEKRLATLKERVRV